MLNIQLVVSQLIKWSIESVVYQKMHNKLNQLFLSFMRKMKGIELIIS